MAVIVYGFSFFSSSFSVYDLEIDNSLNLVLSPITKRVLNSFIFFTIQLTP